MIDNIVVVEGRSKGVRKKQQRVGTNEYILLIQNYGNFKRVIPPVVGMPFSVAGSLERACTHLYHR
jgi:hypothetical protein